METAAPSSNTLGVVPATTVAGLTSQVATSPHVTVDAKVPAATAARLQQTADAFDAWLQLNGVSNGLAHADGRVLALRAEATVLSGAHYDPAVHAVVLQTGALQPRTLMSLSPDVVAHELAHASPTNRRLMPALDEAVADVLALSFVRSTGQGALDDWTIDADGREVVRDMAKPRFATVQRAEAHILSHSAAAPWYPTHSLGDPVRTVMYGLAKLSGWAHADRIFRQALMRELPSREIEDWGNVQFPRMTTKRQMRDLYATQMQAIADATLAAASRLFGPRSKERADVLAMWGSVGVTPIVPAAGVKTS